MESTDRRSPAARSLFLSFLLTVAVTTACWGLAGSNADPAGDREPAPPAAPFDATALDVGPLAEVATFDVAVEGDPRPLRVVSVLWAPPTEHDGPPIIRWQFYSESFENVHKSYHVRFTSFFDLDPRSLTPNRRTRSFLTWEGGACCELMERDEEGNLELHSLHPLTLPVGPTKVVLGQMPLLVRAARFPPSGRIGIEVLRQDGTTVPAEILLKGSETWSGPDGPVRAERIVVHYDDFGPEIALQGLMVSTGAKEEIYWREAEGNHQLLGIDTARYEVPMTVRLHGETRRKLTAPDPTEPPALRQGPPPSKVDRSRNERPDGRPAPALDQHFLSLPRWDDGRAELAYYELDGEGQEGPGQVALAILVKHRIDPVIGSKRGAEDPGAVDSLFTVFLASLADPGSPVPVRRFFSGQALQHDLTPVTAGIAEVSGTDQCGALLWLNPGASIPDARECHVRQPPPLPQVPVASAAPERTAYLVHQMPLVIRALTLDRPSDPVPGVGRSLGELAVRLPDGRLTTATVRYRGRETLTTPAGEYTCDRLEVRYDRPPNDPWAELLPTSLLGPLPETETYWRDTGEHHQIVRMESDDLTLTLIEEIRARHWSEDFYPRLQRVTAHP